MRDPSAGIMRAVVAGICPTAIVVDLAHDIAKYAIRDGALILWSAVPYLPVGTHVAIVDPGVGTARQGIAIQALRGDFLVGPDNGLLMPAAARLGGITRAHLLENPQYSLPEVSSSFHGRDVFAPAAAHLSAGVAIEALGRAVDPRLLLDLDWPRPGIYSGRLRTQAIYIDTFGNVKLSALADDLASALPGLRLGERLVVRIGEGQALREIGATWARTFGDIPEGAALVTADSYGRASLAVYQGSAADAFGVTRDEIVEVTRPPSRPASSSQPRPPSPPPSWHQPRGAPAPPARPGRPR
jgi:hypothetical protein